MRFEKAHRILPLLLLAVSSAAPAADLFAPDRGDSGSLNQFPVRVLPVLVNVDSKGRIVNVASAYQLSPRFNRLLTKNVSEMISKPAVDKQGHAVSSQFVLNLAMQATPREDGNYDTEFRYVSAQPVPSGRWGWAHTDGYDLALLDLSGPSVHRPMAVTPDHRSGAYSPQDRMPSPSSQPASMRAPASAAPQGASRSD